MNICSMLCHYLQGLLEKYKPAITNIIGEIIYFLINFGDAILEPTVRLLIYHASCLHILPGPSGCYNSTAALEDEPGIQSLAAEYMMFRRLMLGLPILVIGLFCGSWSDKFGNKIPVIVPTFGNLAGVLLYIVVTLNPGRNIPLLLVGASFRGICGRTPIITMATHSYVSEVSTEDQRTGRLSILQSMNYFGYLSGSFMLGVLLDFTSYGIIFGIVLVLFSLCIPITLIFMTDKSSVKGISLCGPCSGTTEEDEDNPEKDRPYWFSLSYVRDSLSVLTVQRECYRRMKLWLLFGLMFMTQAWKSGEIEIMVLFTERPPFSLSDGHYGYLLATESACMAFSTCVVVPILSGWFKVGDVALIMIGTTARMVRLVIFIYARSTGVLYLAIILGSPISISVTGLRALISKVVKREELNRVFSLLSCIETGASLIGAFIFLSIYTNSSRNSDKVTFEVAIAVQVALLGLMLVLEYLNRKYAENYETLDEEEDSGIMEAKTPTSQFNLNTEDVTKIEPVETTQIEMYTKIESEKKYNAIY